MTISKLHKPVSTLTPQQIAQKVANEGLKGAIEHAISRSGDDYRTQFKKILDSKRPATTLGAQRFRAGAADAEAFLEQVYEHLPHFFKKLVDDAVEEQGRLHNLTNEQRRELTLELANVIDSELRLKGKFA